MHLELTPHASEVLEVNYKETRGWMKGKMASLTQRELSSVRRAMEILKKTFTPGES